MQNLVPESRIKAQAFWFYFVAIAWPLYQVSLPYVSARLGWLSLAYMVFPGVYLFTWLGLLMHESWHRYVRTASPGFFYRAFSVMILSDPQVYTMLHGHHHAKVHTFEDAEFYPVGPIRNRAMRVASNALEILLGIAYLVALSTVAVPRDARFATKYRYGKALAAALSWVLFLGGLGLVAHRIFGVTVVQIVVPFAASYWLGSFVLHQSQLIEHGNLIVNGSLHTRNLFTRNLAPAGIAERLVLLLTHDDSREHVLHHTMAPLYLRPFAGVVALPAEAVRWRLRDHVRVLGRMIAGVVETVTPDEVAA